MLDRKVCSLLKARNVAYRSGDRLVYSNAQRELKKGITEAKQRYQQRIEGHFINNNPRSMWRGIKAITDYKSITPLTSHDATLPDALNEFFARFDNQTSQVDTQTTLLPRDEPVIIPESRPGCLPIYSTTTIVPVPKIQQVRCLNDYHPVALTPIIMKCFERMVLPHIKASIPTDLDSHQFAYHGNRSTEDAISTALHTSLSHLEHPNTYVRMLFVDFSSAFNTIVPHKLVDKRNNLGLTTTLCSWTLLMDSGLCHKQTTECQ
ncbi:hypothetical protein QTP86_016349, partial [Hemibagrus guttatus]